MTNNNDHLVHVSGFIQVGDRITDSETGISADNAIRLERLVEMSQWEEKKTEQRINENQVKVSYSYTL
jgi:hypothetical protein